MHDHARRLHHHDEIVIFMEDLKRNIFWDRLDLLGLGQVDFHFRTLGDACLWIRGDRPVHPHSARAEKRRETGPRKSQRLWHITCQGLIKPGRRVRPDLETMRGRGHG